MRWIEPRAPGIRHSTYSLQSIAVVFVLVVSQYLSAQTWTQLSPTGGPPPARQSGSTSFTDPNTDRLIMFGGSGAETDSTSCSAVGGFFVNGRCNFNDAWVLTNADGLGGTPAWTQLSPATFPPARGAHSEVYDTANNRMIIFGGCNGGCDPILNDVWVLSNANGLGGTPAWTQLCDSASCGGAQGSPQARLENMAVYDPASNRMTIYGGEDSSGNNKFQDVWVLSNANGLGGTSKWTKICDP